MKNLILIFLLLVPTLSFADDDSGISVFYNLEIQSKPKDGDFNCWYKNPFYKKGGGIMEDIKFLTTKSKFGCARILEVPFDFGTDDATSIIQYMNDSNPVFSFK
jgi:hypothetical protein